MLKNWLRRRRFETQNQPETSAETIRRKLADYQSSGERANFTGPFMHYNTPLFPEEAATNKGNP